ncbi:uncharacterized protein LOC120332522 [Styela clava]
MELDELQRWIEHLYNKVKEYKERAEYQAYVLDEISQPWPFSSAPKSAQDGYKQSIEQRKENEEKISKVANFDKELENVEDILQKARLLHEKVNEKPATKTQKIKENETKKVNSALPQKSDPKKGLIKSERLSSTSNKTKIVPNLSRNSKILPNKASSKISNPPFYTKPTRGRIRSAGYQRGQNKPTVKPNSNKSTTVSKSLELLKQIKVQTTQVTTNDENISKTEDKKISPPLSEHNNPPVVKNVEIDFTKVKLKYRDFANDLELPHKVRKLLSTHEKLCDQACDALHETECKEETNFVKNMASSAGDTTLDGTVTLRTLEAVNSELDKCIAVSTNAINILKYQSEYQPLGRNSKLRWSEQQNTYLRSESVKIVEEVYYHLWEKVRYFSNLKILVSNDKTEKNDLNFNADLLSSLRLDNFACFHDDLPYPASVLTYQTSRELSKKTCEQLMHKCLIIEKNLLWNISKTYFNLIGKMVSGEKGGVPSENLTHVLQNTYGLLGEKKILLPSYVLAE